MQKHLGRVAKWGWLPLVAVTGALVSDMPAAIDHADKNIHDVLFNAGVSNPPQHLATWLWQHPLSWILIVAALFGVGGAISWGAERLAGWIQSRLGRRASSATGAAEQLPIWQAVEHVRAVIGDNDEDNCYPEARREIRQAALGEQIKLVGRRELPPPHAPGYHSDVWTEVPPKYWKANELNALATGCAYTEHEHTWPEPFVVHGFKNRYWSLKAIRSEIEQRWRKSANVGFDTTLHHLVRYVAIESQWAASFVPNNSPDYLVRALNDPWDALAHEICGPLSEGRLKARGILHRRNEAKRHSYDDIPRDFWLTAQIYIQELLLNRKANGASLGNDTYSRIMLPRQQITDIWPGRTIEEQCEKPSPFVGLSYELLERRGKETDWNELPVPAPKMDHQGATDAPESTVGGGSLAERVTAQRLGPAVKEALLEAKWVRPDLSSETSPECALIITAKVPLEECRIEILEVVGDGEANCAGLLLRAGRSLDAATTFAIKSSQSEAHFTFLTRDLADKLNRPPFYLHTSGGDRALLDGVDYYVRLRLLSQAPDPTYLTLFLRPDAGAHLIARQFHQGPEPENA
jgi:hypothetical protein